MLPSVVWIAFLLLPLVILATLVTLNPTYAEGLSYIYFKRGLFVFNWGEKSIHGLDVFEIHFF